MIVSIFARIRSGSRQDLSSYLLPLLMLVTVAVTGAALAWSYTNHYIITYGDAITHLFIARRVIDNITPGAAQLGSSWLPLLHVLELPFIWNDHLWHSGLAGGIVSTVAAWGSAFFAFRLAQELSGSKFAGFAAGLLLLSNPNLLYMQTTPMNESLFICTTLGSAHYLVRWVKDSRDQDLVLAGLFGLATAFNRYEGWALILAQAVVVAIIGWRRGGWPMAEGMGLAYASLAGLAPFLWFTWNWAIFRDPFNFLRDPFSSGSNVELIMRQYGVSSPTLHNIPNDLRYYAFTVYDMAGPVLSFAALAGLACLILTQIRRRSIESQSLLLLALAVPGLFTVITLYQGSSMLLVKSLPPYRDFDVRYGLYILPLILGLVALLGRLPWGTLLLSAVLLAQLALLVAGPSVTAFDEPRVSVTACAAADNVRLAAGSCVALAGVSQYLGQSYDGGHVLISSKDDALEWVLHSSGLPVKEFIHEGNQNLWRDALQNPTPYARWIVMVAETQPELAADLVFLSLYDSPALANDYTKVIEQQGIAIYRRNDQVPPPSAVSGGHP